MNCPFWVVVNKYPMINYSPKTMYILVVVVVVVNKYSTIN